MRLAGVKLESFRNYEKLEVEFPKKAHRILLIGENGQGKTNLLEAIYMLSVARSFRTKKIQDLIYWEKDFTRVQGQLVKKEDELELEVFLSQPKKATKRNELIIPSSEFIGTLNAVLFHPQDMNLLLLSPELRRKYINILASQVDREYLEALVHYGRVLKNRNQLLVNIQLNRSKEDECFFWDQQLAQCGAKLIFKRQEIVKFLNESLTEIYQKISDGEEKIEVRYQTIVKNDMSISELEMYFSSRLLEKRDIDLRRGYTSIGPHRDDLKFFLDGKEIDTHGSRGECRSLLISLKLAEIEFIKKNTGEEPVLLLDDVFSELDDHRQESLLKAIDSCQTFITGTSSNGLEKLKATHKFTVEKGGVIWYND